MAIQARNILIKQAAIPLIANQFTPVYSFFSLFPSWSSTIKLTLAKTHIWNYRITRFSPRFTFFWYINSQLSFVLLGQRFFPLAFTKIFPFLFSYGNWTVSHFCLSTLPHTLQLSPPLLCLYPKIDTPSLADYILKLVHVSDMYVDTYTVQL